MFSVAGRDGLLPTISAYLHIERLTPVIPCIIEGILGMIYSTTLKIECTNTSVIVLFILFLSRHSLCACW